MGTPISVLIGSRTLNTSGSYDVTLGAATSIIVERNANTPANDPVNVVFDTVGVGALSSITVQNASLTIDNVVGLNVLSSYNIGSGGKLDLSNVVGINVLSPITFTGVGGILVVDPTVNLSLLSNVTGFDSDDVISFAGVSSATGVRYQGGSIQLLDGDSVIASTQVSGDFDASQLGFQSNGQGGINVGIGLGNGGGRPDDTFVTGLHSEYIIAQTPLGQLYLQDKVGGRDATATVQDAHYILFADGVARFDASGAAQEVAHLYRATFDRRPDAAGLDFWTEQVENGTHTASSLAVAFASSTEFSNNYANLDDSQYIGRLYNNVLGREGEAGGIAFWLNELTSGNLDRAGVLKGFAESFENVSGSLDFAGDREYGQAYRLYEAALNRTPDTEGLRYWYEQLENGLSASDAAKGFVESVEFNNNYGNLDNAGYVNQLYLNVLDRAGDQAGQQFWIQVLENGSTRADVLLGFADSLEARILTADITHDSWVYLGS